MIDEWPLILCNAKDPLLQDGELAPEQVLITDTGYEISSGFPLEEQLL